MDIFFPLAGDMKSWQNITDFCYFTISLLDFILYHAIVVNKTMKD